MGREYALTTRRFREAKSHRPLCGDELEDGFRATSTLNGHPLILRAAVRGSVLTDSTTYYAGIVDAFALGTAIQSSGYTKMAAPVGWSGAKSSSLCRKAN
jgi:hypothetical protein